jgi:hypothetical protein
VGISLSPGCQQAVRIMIAFEGGSILLATGPTI